MKRMLSDRKSRNTLIFLVLVLFLSLLSLFIKDLLFGGNGQMCAVVTLEGREYGAYPLSRDTEFDIVNQSGESNHFVIRDGFAGIDRATCKNQICVHEGFHKNPGEVITCLPNGVVITFEPR